MIAATLTLDLPGLTATTVPEPPASRARYRYIGVTDECVECQKCGKADLKRTIVLAFLDEDGNIEDYTYYGSTCAARALAEVTGRRHNGRTVLALAENAARRLKDDAADCRKVLAKYGLDGVQPFAWKTFRDAAIQYRYNNFGNPFAPVRTWEDWQNETWDLLDRRTAIIREAEQFGL